MDYKDIRLEEIEKAVQEFADANPDIFVEELPSGLFRLPGGAIANKAGLELINEAMQEQANKLSNNPSGKKKSSRQNKSKYIP